MTILAMIPDRAAVDLVPSDANGNRRSRLAHFAEWLEVEGQPWYSPDLAAWRDSLAAAGLAPSSVGAYLSTVRGRYAELLREPGTRDALYALAGEALERMGQADNPANRAAFVGELERRLENALTPEAAPIQTVTRQDRPDSDGLRLTKEQADALLAAPGVETLRGLRDTALVALMLCTGIREAEVAGLDVADLRQRLGGELALHVRSGKGRKERLVPYGALEWVLAVVDKWREAAAIDAGPVFRGFYKGGRLRPQRLTTRQVQNILKGYPVMVEGELTAVRPHDLRRTYARRLYEAGVDILAIRDNLGHGDHKTTLRYIGALDVGRRRPPAVYSFDLGRLRAVAVQGRLDD